eukprot:CAMPEP_0171571290 /NCGR_PEP_ID=MMETSP0961-20121227/3432_1 /TAXON_ID=87120 /ORGANISM="Aurantiochytrium limacinum, Strain ATCCMYA-1381" /LENGTH=67 /DNA_ID=CAMNT_0012125903 /DNA_START=37 /DNA_END=240 /DNA_ORIENTATION=+
MVDVSFHGQRIHRLEEQRSKLLSTTSTWPSTFPLPRFQERANERAARSNGSSRRKKAWKTAKRKKEE